MTLYEISGWYDSTHRLRIAAPSERCGSHKLAASLTYTTKRVHKGFTDAQEVLGNTGSENALHNNTEQYQHWMGITRRKPIPISQHDSLPKTVIPNKLTTYCRTPYLCQAGPNSCRDCSTQISTTSKITSSYLITCSQSSVNIEVKYRTQLLHYYPCKNAMR